MHGRFIMTIDRCSLLAVFNKSSTGRKEPQEPRNGEREEKKTYTERERERGHAKLLMCTKKKNVTFNVK